MKLLYTLHWLLLNAVSECSETCQVDETEQKIKMNNMINNSESNKKRKFDFQEENLNDTPYLYSIAMIQLFVYLFIPIAKTLNENDLMSLNLDKGLTIWESLWSFKAPNISIFSTAANYKPTGCENKIVCIESDDFHGNDSIKKQNGFEVDGLHSYKKAKAQTLHDSFENTKYNLFLETLNTNEDFRNGSCNDNKIIYRYDSIDESNFNGKIKKSESGIRLSSILIKSVGNDAINDNDSAFIRAPLAHMNSICSFHDSPLQNIINIFPLEQTISSENSNENEERNQHDESKCVFMRKNFSYKNVANTKSNESQPLIKTWFKTSAEILSDVKSGTYFDVAILRCLLNSKWNTDGYKWGLEYLYSRILEITEDIIKKKRNKVKSRSCSLPVTSNFEINNNKLSFLQSKNTFNVIQKLDKKQSLNNKKLKNHNGISVFDKQIRYKIFQK